MCTKWGVYSFVKDNKNQSREPDEISLEEIHYDLNRGGGLDSRQVTALNFNGHLTSDKSYEIDIRSNKSSIVVQNKSGAICYFKQWLCLS